jgi:predicted RecB family endonuclease
MMSRPKIVTQQTYASRALGERPMAAFTLARETHAAIEQYAKKLGISKSSLVERAIWVLIDTLKSV